MSEESIYFTAPGSDERDLNPGEIDCAKHGRTASIDPNTGRPPVYRRSRRVEQVVEAPAISRDEKGGIVLTPGTAFTTGEIFYGPELPAGGGVCRACFLERGGRIGEQPPQPPATSVIDKLAGALGMSPDALRETLRQELKL